LKQTQNAAPTKKGTAVYAPMAFTEQGVAMLSSVLNSARATKGQYPNHSPVYKDEGNAVELQRPLSKIRTAGKEGGAHLLLETINRSARSIDVFAAT